MFIPAYRDCLGSSVLRQSADAYVGYLLNRGSNSGFACE